MLGDFLRPEDLCFTIQEEIAPRIKLEDFEAMYSEGGRPPVSPRVLLLVLIMQYIERLSDRAAAHNLRFRLDWKIAFDLELDFKGIHPTTLVYFRERLLANEKAGYAFDKVLEHLKEVGLVKKGAKQRIDSTHVIGNVRELSRIELFHETLRLFCKDIAHCSLLLSSEAQANVAYYCDDISTRGASDQQKAKYIREAGLTMRLFIDWSKHAPKYLKINQLGSFKTLQTVFEQNFDDSNPDPDGEPELIKVATGKDHICSPHEAEARYANKGSKKWLGYKAQVAETVAEQVEGEKKEVNFITFVDVQDAPEHDSTIVSPYIEDQISKDVVPQEVYGDTHYNSSCNIETLAEKDVELKGPVAPIPQKEAEEKNQGFVADIPGQKIICPGSHESKKFAVWENGKVAGSFHAKHCFACVRQFTCLPESRGKRISFRPESDLLKSRRALMETEEFKLDMHKRNGIEGTISGLVRGQGMRRSRFRGKAKARLQIKMCGTAANIMRLHRKRVEAFPKMGFVAA